MFRRWIVTALESLCVVTHYWPLVLLPGRNCKLAYLSMWLDERWGVGQWKKVTDD